MGLGKIGVNILTRGLVVILFVSLFIPLRAFAFDWCFGFCGKVNAAEQEMPNSQNMALALQAVNSPDMGASTTKGDISIVSDTSLSPELQGPFSDGQDHSTQTDQISLYVVRSGDTLPAIAKMFGVTTNTIVWANDLKANKISVGQTLVIMPISGIKYSVVKGDTLQGIAKKFKGDMTEILQYNNLTSNAKLAVGDTVFIPDGEATPISTPKYANKTSSSQQTGSSQIGSYPVYDGYYIRPIVGGIKTQGIHGHNGVDLASSYGTNIMASADGAVIIAKSSGWNGGYGKYVVISHANGTQTVYGHMSQVNVSIGDNVQQGQVIGHMGSTGNSTGNHVHFEIRGARNPF